MTGRQSSSQPTPEHQPTRPFPLLVGEYPNREEVEAARAIVYGWLDLERGQHADQKYDRTGEWYQRMYDDMRSYVRGDAFFDREWGGFLASYVNRVEVYGLGDPRGRQAMGKLIVTAMACLEAAVIVHGPMPLPGQSSGNVEMGS